jgi:hypothetical protein
MRNWVITNYSDRIHKIWEKKNPKIKNVNFIVQAGQDVMQAHGIYSPTCPSLIKKIAYAKSVKLKLVGKQYYDTKTMSIKQIQHFKYSYEYYKAMGGTFN